MNNKKENKEKTVVTILISILVLIIIVIVGMTAINGKGNEGSKKPNDKQKGPDSSQIAKEYGVTEEDAINVIKKIYTGDNYKFSVTTNSNSMYVVTVTNEDTNTKTVYEVDPNNKQHKEIETGLLHKDTK